MLTVLQPQLHGPAANLDKETSSPWIYFFKGLVLPVKMLSYFSNTKCCSVHLTHEVGSKTYITGARVWTHKTPILITQFTKGYVDCDIDCICVCLPSLNKSCWRNCICKTSWQDWWVSTAHTISIPWCIIFQSDEQGIVRCSSKSSRSMTAFLSLWSRA